MLRVVQRLFGTAVMLGGLAACSSGGTSASASPSTSTSASGREAASAGKARARELPVGSPSAIAYEREVTIQGAVEAVQSVQVAARVEGAVTAVMKDLGDRVRRGDVLAKILVTDYAAKLAQTRADLEQARADRARIAGLVESENATRQMLEQAVTRVRVLEAQQALAARQLADTTVRAPFDGAIAARHVSTGAYVRIASPLYDLVSIDDLRVALEVPSLYAARVSVGDEVRIESAGETVVARIARVAPSLSSTTRTLRIEARPEARDGSAPLRPGTFVTGHISVGRVEGAVTVPRSAVFQVLGHDRVVLVVDGRAVLRDVELVGEVGTNAVVLGITSSDRVVVRGAASVAPGTPIREASGQTAAKGR